MTQRVQLRRGMALGGLLLSGLTGCASMPVHRHERDQHGIVYYLDGAGGGSVLTDWGAGVRDGLKKAGYRGEFYSFPWHTSLGVAADQAASVQYKRTKAAQLAAITAKYVDEHPHTPVHLIGLSAGTAIAVFTLEALPEKYRVDNAVMLGSSLSAHYDLTCALKRVRDRMYVFTSQKDAVLSYLVPLAGTADRKYCGACAAGLQGFHAEPAAGAEQRKLYSRVENIAWDPKFEKAGHFGGHTDPVNPRFIRTFVAPLLLRDGPRFTQAGPQPEANAPDQSDESGESNQPDH